MSILLVQPIPYQGSKRNLAKYILKYFPSLVVNLYEPFAGSGAITLASASQNKATHYFLNDLNSPLMTLWYWMINYPEELAKEYQNLWNEQLSDPKGFYSQVRDRFNANFQPTDFLYLLARGVKGAIRYNSQGQYNQSPDNRRLGKKPETMRKDILTVSKWLKNKTTISAMDYREATTNATPNDLVYLDPPYQGTCTGRDNRYYSGVKFDDLVQYLEDLNSSQVPWILSYDGSRGDKTYGKKLPKEVHGYHLLVNAGRSSQDTLNGGNAITYESVYLSAFLKSIIKLPPQESKDRVNSTQLTIL